MSEEPKITYIIDGCFKWTFDAKKVKRYVEENCKGTVLNLFAGKNHLNMNEVRVDSSNEFKPDYHMGAEKFIGTSNGTFDTVIYDPPWNERKSKEFYNGRYIGKFTKLKSGIVSLLNELGIIISVGYEITNFGYSRGMELIKLAVVNPKGETRPYFVSVERLKPILDNYIPFKKSNEQR